MSDAASPPIYIGAQTPSERGSSSMSTWYKIGRWEPKIEPVEVVKHTEKTVTLAKTKYWRERRADRQGMREQYYPTWQEAHTALLRRAVGELDSARRGLHQAEDFYGNVKGMKQPESETDVQAK